MAEPPGSGSNPWICVAAFEVSSIIDRWGLGSLRDSSRFLGINRRTLAKLDPKHPDGSLRLESLDRIYATFLHLVPYHFPERERDNERNRLYRSRCWVLEHSYPLPEKLRDLYKDI